MSTRRDFLKSAGLVVMAGASGFLGLDQFVYGKDDGIRSARSRTFRSRRW